jgi:hypothetical protein
LEINQRTVAVKRDIFWPERHHRFLLLPGFSRTP